MPYQNYRKNYKKNFIQKKKWASIMKDIPSTNVQIPGQSTQSGDHRADAR